MARKKEGGGQAGVETFHIAESLYVFFWEQSEKFGLNFSDYLAKIIKASLEAGADDCCQGGIGQDRARVRAVKVRILAELKSSLELCASRCGVSVDQLVGWLLENAKDWLQHPPTEEEIELLGL